MMTGNWTQAPWTAEESFRGDSWGVYSDKHIDCGKYVSQTVAKLDYRTDEAKANARLIAAAPDLYEALEAFLLQYLSAPSDATFGDGLLDQEKAEAALKKAKGHS